MAKFCTQCGRPLADGEICMCQMAKNQQTNQQDGYYAGGQAGQQNQYHAGGQTGQQNQYYAGGQQPGRGTNQGNQSYTISTEDWIPLRKLIGIGEADHNDVEGCFERGKKIVPDLIAPCEQEIPIKQYQLCNARSRLRGLWQEGRIQVTNKRVIFRLSGRSWIGRAMSHTEFTIDEVAGVALSNGVRFALWDFLLGLLISMIALGFGSFFGRLPVFLAYILGIAAAAPFFLFKKKYYIKALFLAFSMGAITISAGMSIFEHPFLAKVGVFLTAVVLILYIIALFLFSLKPSLSIKVMTKCASDSPIAIWSAQTMVSVMEVLPGEDADVAIEELGSMITDIQKLGDFGIRKWKVD